MLVSLQHSLIRTIKKRTPNHESYRRRHKPSGCSSGLRVKNEAELESDFAALAHEGAGALILSADPFFDTNRDRIVAWATAQRLPAMLTLFLLPDRPNMLRTLQRKTVRNR